MKKTFTLSIPNSCAEKWENFTTTRNGGFCHSCNKTVVDFTAMSDEEIIHHFKNKPHTCGKFRINQLKPYEFQTAPRLVHPGLSLLKAGLLSLFLVLVSRPTFAQVKTEPATEVVQTVRTAGENATDKEYTIKGVVTSAEDGSALPGVNIFLKNNVSVGTVSDSEGRFEFPTKLKQGDVILFTFIGLETQEYTVPADATNDLDVKLSISMEMSCYVTLGEVAIDEAYSEPSAMKKLWSKVKAIF